MKQHYHFLGVGGIGMSALARILIDQGQCVTGSDLAEIPALEKIGVRKLEELPKQGAIVYSSAIQESHPLLLQAKNEARPLFHRSLLLKELMGKQKALLVTGTHGKTSTSSLLTWVLSYAKQDPSFAVGGILQNLQKNGGWGKGEYFVAEADESDGSFLNYQGEGGIVTNLEQEHLAYWKTQANLCKGFQTFFQQIKNQKLFFWCSDDPLLKSLKPPGISYGKQGELKLLKCQQEGGRLIFSASFRGKIYEAIELPLMGEKLALNGLAVFGLALQLGVSEKEIREAFLSFKGVKRRQEMVGQVNGILVYDDYAHHPTEIKAVLEGLRKKNPKGRLVALFEPHRFSRTEEQMEQFSDVFQEADLAVITSIYSAGESPIPGVTGKALANRVGREKVLFLEKEKLMAFLPKMLLPGDLFVTMGAGGITTFGPKLIEALS
ncbi:MAG: UDP-N-acetylmuramate--L-alanine ligase [Chlamydiales bacterium]|nr:UDP-N-acetylmuramate--L-alanine ligase [Chlamydiales bacterium]